MVACQLRGEREHLSPAALEQATHDSLKSGLSGKRGAKQGSRIVFRRGNQPRKRRRAKSL